MRNPLPPLLVLSLSWAMTGAGCNSVRMVTESERESSFQPLEDREIGGESLRMFVLRRTALLVNLDDLAISDQGDPSEAVLQGKPQGNVDLHFGSAAAVDPRGYFVTAAHCVEDREVSVVFWSESGLGAVPARVVFLGDPNSRFADFAVLHVPVRLETFFRWGDPPGAGATLVSAGISERDENNAANEVSTLFTLEPVAGPLVEIIEKDVEGIRFQLLRHDSPLERGNSGGPVVDERGRLLAVNSTGAAAYPVLGAKAFKFPGAVRPDPEWLAELIRKDARSHSDS